MYYTVTRGENLMNENSQEEQPIVDCDKKQLTKTVSKIKTNEKDSPPLLPVNNNNKKQKKKK